MARQRKSKSSPKETGAIVLQRDVKRHDIVLGRGKKRFKHPANVAYRALIHSRLPIYFKGERPEKSSVVLEIIRSIKDNGSRFLKAKGAAWQEVDLRVAREKVGHSIRDTIKSNISFPFQDEMKRLFDEQSTYAQILDYVIRNYEMIESQIEEEEANVGKKRKLKMSTAAKTTSVDSSSNTTSSPSTVSSNDDESSISSHDDSDSDFAIQDIPAITRRRSSAVRHSFVNKFVDKVSEEAQRIASIDFLLRQKEQYNTFQLVSFETVDDWIDYESCSQHSDDEWCEHLVSLV